MTTHVLVDQCPSEYISYGKIAKYVGAELLEQGFKVTYLCPGALDLTVAQGAKRADIKPDAVLMTPQGPLGDTYAYYVSKLSPKPDYVLIIGAPWDNYTLAKLRTYAMVRQRNPKPEIKHLKLVGYFSFDWYVAPKPIKDTFGLVHTLAFPTKAEARYVAAPPDRVTIVPHGVNGDIFNPDIKAAQFNIPKGYVTIGSVMKNHGRKNWGLAYFAVYALSVWGFKVAFLPLTTVATGSQNAWFMDALRTMTDDFPTPSDVASIMMVGAVPNTIGLPEEEQAQVMKSMDVHILPTRGEGFSLAILESMALGIPNVATETEVLKEVYGKYKSVVFVDDVDFWVWPGEGTLFVEPRFLSFTDKLLDVVEHLDEYKERALKDSEYVRREYPWSRTAKGIIAALEQADKFDTTIAEDISNPMAGGGMVWQ